MFEWHKKEAPFFTGITRGVGGFGFGSKRAAAGPTGPFSATGGTTYTSGDYKLHVFTFPNSDPFNVASGGAGEILVLAGGGSGAPDQMGGGGAGGVVYTTSVIQFQATNYPVVVGNGGPSSPYSQYGAGQKGQDSTFGSSPQNIYLIALGGGGAKNPVSLPQSYADNAGCGGGGANGVSAGFPASQPGQSQTAPAPVVSTGFAGGAHPGSATGNNTGSGGGGGGAGQAGNHGGPPAPGPTRGVGGDGYQVPAPFIDPFIPVLPNPFLGIANNSPAFRYFGGGGGGADNNNNGGTGRGFGAPGGLGGGGRGCVDPGPGSIPGTPAISGRGGGGGGGSTHSGIGGAGGSGCVLIKYKFQ